MIHGEQWDCKCGWSNVYVRIKCRNCGKLAPKDMIERVWGKDEMEKWYTQEGKCDESNSADSKHNLAEKH